MKEEYWWDKTGEPDEELKELEEILGELRYRPLPLDVSKNVLQPRRRSYIATLAIAATVVISLLAAGVWFALQTRKTPATTASSQMPVATPNHSPETSFSPSPTDKPVVRQEGLAVIRTPSIRRTTTSVRKHQEDRTGVALSAREREEALAAKQQLLLALRVASEKLNEAQRKAQGPALSPQTRNQHKIG